MEKKTFTEIKKVEMKKEEKEENYRQRITMWAQCLKLLFVHCHNMSLSLPHSLRVCACVRSRQWFECQTKIRNNEL